MSAASFITKAIDLFYVYPLSKMFSRRVFRYAACGAANMALDTLWYFIIYNFIVCKRYVDFGIVDVAFSATHISGRRQLARYLLTVAGSILLNYVMMKLLVEGAGVWATPSKMITTLVCAVYSYLAGRYYTFAK